MLLSHEGFMETLPRGPLVQHLARVYAITLHLYGQTDPSNEVAVEAMAHSLREIAIYTCEVPEYRIPASAGTHDSGHKMDVRYDANLLEPRYEPIPSGIETLNARITTVMREAGESLRRITAPKTPEQVEARARRRYERQCDEQRAAAKMHLRNEVRRVRAELGLPENTSPTKRGQS